MVFNVMKNMLARLLQFSCAITASIFLSLLIMNVTMTESFISQPRLSFIYLWLFISWDILNVIYAPIALFLELKVHSHWFDWWMMDAIIFLYG